MSGQLSCWYDALEHETLMERVIWCSRRQRRWVRAAHPRVAFNALFWGIGRLLERDRQDSRLGRDREGAVDRAAIRAFDHDAFDEARRAGSRLIRGDHDAESEERPLQRSDDGRALLTRDLDRCQARAFLLEANLWMFLGHLDHSRHGLRFLVCQRQLSRFGRLRPIFSCLAGQGNKSWPDLFSPASVVFELWRCRDVKMIS